MSFRYKFLEYFQINSIAAYLLSFLFLGLLPLFALFFNNGSMDFQSSIESATTQTGIIWTSNIITMLRLSFVEPVLLLMLLGSAAPTFAALFSVYVSKNDDKWSKFFSRLKPAPQIEFTKAITLISVSLRYQIRSQNCPLLLTSWKSWSTLVELRADVSRK